MISYPQPGAITSYGSLSWTYWHVVAPAVVAAPATAGKSSVNIRNSVHGGFESVTWSPIIKKVGEKGTDIA